MHPRARMACLLLGISAILFGGFFLYGNSSEGFSVRPANDVLTYTAPFSADFSWETLPPSRKLEWTKCYSRRECARLIVPLNHSDPDGPETVIALIRKPSKFEQGSEYYRGPVLFNPGGPGGSGVETVLRGGDLLGTIIGPQFDVVGFDPRGVSRSTPRASFFKTEVERELWGWNRKTVVNNSDEGVARTWARAHVVGKLAAEFDSGYLRHINTDNTARDMLSIVKAHGPYRKLGRPKQLHNPPNL